jgi:hypothetical protein
VTDDPVVNPAVVFGTTEINLGGYDLEEVDPCAEAEHPVVGALCGVFFPYLGASSEMIAGWHADGFGFGVITQALFMAQQLEGDMTMAGLILEAKKSGDYSGFGDEYAEITNWGQFKKAVMAGENKSMTNQGAIMSGVLPRPEHAFDDDHLDTVQARGGGRSAERAGARQGKARGNHSRRITGAAEFCDSAARLTMDDRGHPAARCDGAAGLAPFDVQSGHRIQCANVFAVDLRRLADLTNIRKHVNCE